MTSNNRETHGNTCNMCNVAKYEFPKSKDPGNMCNIAKFDFSKRENHGNTCNICNMCNIKIPSFTKENHGEKKRK